jgi:hypothetical protein
MFHGQVIVFNFIEVGARSESISIDAQITVLVPVYPDIVCTVTKGKSPIGMPIYFLQDIDGGAVLLDKYNAI